MADGTGLNRFAKHFPDRFFDVGIAEEHALTFAAGLVSEVSAAGVPEPQAYAQQTQNNRHPDNHKSKVKRLKKLLRKK